MANWRDELWRVCKEMRKTGGEVHIIFTERLPNKRIPIINFYPKNHIVCDEEVVIPDD